MRRNIGWALLTAMGCLLLAGITLAAEPDRSDLDQVTRFSLGALPEQETRLARMAAPDAQSQLLAEVFPGTRPDAAGSMAPLRDDHSLMDGRAFLRVEGGAEVVDNRMGFRLGAGGSVYGPDRRWGLRLDAATVQGDAQREVLKLLLSAGTKLGQRDQLVFSAGWLNRYAWGNFSEAGDQGDNISQYVLGLELERRLRERGEGTAPGVTTFLSALYFKSESKTVWSGYRSGENDSAYYRYFYEYGLGGGSQYEALAGVRLNWKQAALEMQAGFRHKEYEEYLGNAGRSDDAPKARASLTFNEVLGNELHFSYSWDPDLRVAGAGLRRPLWGGWSLLARVEQVQGEDRPDDLRYFLGLDYWFGAGKPKAMPRRSASDQRRDQEQEAAQDREKATARGDWLRPVRGSEAEYIQVMRQVQRKTRIWEVGKKGLPEGVTVDKKAGEIVISGLPGVTSVVLVSPLSARPAFTLSGGALRIAIEKLVPGMDNLCQLQQSDGRYSMVLVRTSRGSIIVDGVLYNIDLTECQVAAILANPSLINNPPDPAPTIRTIPDQMGTIQQSFSSDLSAYVNGSGIKEYELTGTLPNGIIFDTSTGLLFGKPTQQGVFYLSFRARNACGWSTQVLVTLIINSPTQGDCGTAIAITAWTPAIGLPVPPNPAFTMVNFTTNNSVPAGNITATVTTDNSDPVTATVVNDDGGAGKQWHVSGDFSLVSGANTYTLTVTVRDACGNTASRSFTRNIGGN